MAEWSRTASGGCAEDGVAEYPSVTGPGLVAAVARLVKNLVTLLPNDVIPALAAQGVLKVMAR